MIQNLYTNLVVHFSQREDFADAIIGPERENWFNGEAICAVGKKGSIGKNWWVYGEMTYKHWSSELGFDPSVVDGSADRKPDIFCIDRDDDEVRLICEAKLVRRSTDSKPFGQGDGNLLTQLDRSRIFALKLDPTPQVCGILYVLYNPANMFIGDGDEDPECPGLSINTNFETVGPDRYFEQVANRWNNQPGTNEWNLWNGEIQRPTELSGLTPQFTNLASCLHVGIGILLHNTDPLFQTQT